MNLSKLPHLSVWQQALLHAALVWLCLTLIDIAFYSYRVAAEGYFLFYEDGTPVTVWQRLGQAVIRWETPVLWAVAIGVEFAFHKVFRKRQFKVFLGACFLLSGSTVGVLLLANQHYAYLGLADFLLAFLEVFVYAVLYALARHFLYQKAMGAEAARQHTQAELDALKAQLNPHFFFNTLNNLYGTALQEKAEKTAHSVAQLSGIMRYVLTEAQQNFTEVGQEISFLQDYLQLQRMRLPGDRENIRLQTNLSYDGKPARIAPLLLIPFLENAFKYGLSLDRPCAVVLDLAVQDGQLDMVVGNQVFADRQADAGAGTGIAHVRRRLELLYPAKHQLEITQTNQFKVRLRLDLR